MLILPLELAPTAEVARRMRPADRAEVFATRWDDDPERLAADCVAASRFGAVLARDDGRPVAALGAAPMWPGCLCVWMFATPDWPGIAGAATRWAHRRLIPVIAASGAHRAECRSLATHAAAHRWLERLGARREALHRRFGRGGEDFVTYAWFREQMPVRCQRTAVR